MNLIPNHRETIQAKKILLFEIIKIFSAHQFFFPDKKSNNDTIISF